MQDEINILHYLSILRKRWLWLFLVCAISGCAGVYHAFTSPRIYVAQSLLYVFPSGGGALIGQIPQSLLSMVGVKGSSGSEDYYLEKLLKSDNLAINVVEKLKLNRAKEFSAEGSEKKPTVVKKDKKAKQKAKKFVYNLKDPDARRVVSKLKGYMTVSNDKKGGLTIICEAPNRGLVAKIVNTYVEVLRSKMTSKAKRNVVFLKQQLEKVQRDLAAAEDRLKQFQEENKVMVLDKQIESEVQEFMVLKSDQIKNKMSLEATQKLIQSSGSLEDLAHLEGQKILYETKQIEMEQALQQFEANLQKYPEKSQQFARLFREVKLQEVIFELFSQQYEMARISQFKEDVYFQVIDKAYPPDRHIRPQKKKILMIAVLIGFFVGISLIFFVEFILSANTAVTSRQESNLFSGSNRV